MWNKCIECRKEVYCFQDRIDQASTDDLISSWTFRFNYS